VIALGVVRVLLDARLQRLLRLLISVFVAALGNLHQREAAVIEVVGKLGGNLRRPRQSGGHFIPLFLLVVGHRQLPEDPMIRRVEARRLLVVLDGPGDVDLHGLVALVRQVDGFDMVAVTTEPEQQRRSQPECRALRVRLLDRLPHALLPDSGPSHLHYSSAPNNFGQRRFFTAGARRASSFQAAAIPSREQASREHGIRARLSFVPVTRATVLQPTVTGPEGSRRTL
jgi:hypothetical protein